MSAMYAVMVHLGIVISDGFYSFRKYWEKTLTPFFRVIPAWITPDRLSWSRVPLGILVAFFLFFYPVNAIAALLYTLAWATDILDGALARFRKQFSIWGCRIDPLADKILNGAIFIGYIATNDIEIYAVKMSLWIIVGMDVLTTITAGLAAYFYEFRIEANIFGKWKFGTQCAGCTALIFTWTSLTVPVLEAAAILGIMSFITYGYGAYQELNMRKA